MTRPDASGGRVLCTSDAAYGSLFVEVTALTATEAAAWGWLLAHQEEFFPAECDVELDVVAVRCRGRREWWTEDSQPAVGPVPGVRQLWRFDVSDAVMLRPVVPVAIDDRPGCPPEALAAAEDHWRAGRVSDIDHERLRVLARAELDAHERYAARARAAPCGAPGVELRADERYAAMALLGHVVRLLVPLLDNEVERELLRSGLAELREQTDLEAARAMAELADDVDESSQPIERPAELGGRRGDERRRDR